MAYDIGPKIGIEGEAEFRQAIRNINTNIRTLGTEMLAVTSAYDANDKSAAALTSRNQVLVKQIDAQKEKLEKLKEGLAASAEKYGESDETTQKWQQTVYKATADLNKMERQLQENNQDLKGNTDEVKENTNELKNQGSVLDSLSDKLKAFGSGLASMAKTAAAGIAAASTAVATLAKSAVEGYAEAEQLVGGVETLFKDSSDKVIQYANDAYKTAGLSANEYMETVTSFSASLLSSLNGDTAKAAEIADQAIIDMSDNANKMGSDMESIQNAYNGFAKGTFNMLDNLKLGYGGTKEEMQRLLSDAEKLSGIKFDISSYSDIIEAIHVVQTEMGITGTTAREASSTIQGSIGAMKSAWQNLVTGLAGDSQNLDQLIANFVDSVKIAGENVIPRIETALLGIGEMISALAPVLAEEAPKLIMDVLPSMLDAGAQLLGGILEGIVSAAPALGESLMQVVDTTVAGLQEAGPKIMETGKALLSFIGEGITNGLPQLAEGAAGIMTGLGEHLQKNLPVLIQSGLEAISSFTDSLRKNAGLVVDGAIELAKSLAQGLADSIPTIIENVPTIVSNIANTINDNAPKILKAGVDIIGTLVKGLIDSIPTIVENMPKIIAAIWDTVTAVNWINLGGSIVKGIGNGISGMVQAARNAIGTIKDALKNGIQELPDAFKTIGKNIIQGLINGVKGMASSAVNSIKELGTSILSGAKSFLGIQSPSKLFRQEVGQYISLGVAEGISDMSDKAVKSADKMAKEVYSRSKDWADKQTKYMGLTYDEQIDLWETIQSQFISSSKQYSDAEEKIFDLRQKKLKASVEAEKAIMSELEDWVGDMEHEMFLNEKNNLGTMEDTIAAYRTMQERLHRTAEEYRSLNYAENSDEIQKLQKMWWNYEDAITKQQEDALKARTDAQKEFVSNIEAIQKDLENLQNGYLKELSKRTEEIANSYKLFDKVADRQDVDGQDLIDNLAGQISSIRGFYGDLDALEARGVGEGLVDEIRKMGVGASDQLDALLRLTDNQLSRYAALYEEKQRLAGFLAERELRESRDAMEQDLKKSLDSMGELMAAQGPEMGKAFSDGIAKGLREGLAGVTEAAISVAEAAVAATKSSMGIASPSKVFAKLGGYMAEGLGQGFYEDMGTVQRRIERSMEELAGNARSTVRMETVPDSRTDIPGNTGSYNSLDIMTALRELLEGMDVYLDGRRVGQLMTNWQNNDNRAWGR